MSKTVEQHLKLAFDVYINKLESKKLDLLPSIAGGMVDILNHEIYDAKQAYNLYLDCDPVPVIPDPEEERMFQDIPLASLRDVLASSKK